MTATPTTLAELRASVDEVDARIVALLAERRRLVTGLAEAKRAGGLHAVDSAREAEIEARWREVAAREGLPEEVALAVLRAVLGSSRAHVVALLARDGGPRER
jgi:chorismate mutase